MCFTYHILVLESSLGPRLGCPAGWKKQHPKILLGSAHVSHHAFASLVSTVADYDELVCCGSSFQ